MVGAHHKPFLDIHFTRMKGVRLLTLGKDVDVPTAEEIERAWTTPDLVNALAHELDAGSRYFHAELVDLPHARRLLDRLERTKQRPAAALYFQARIHVHAGDKKKATAALQACGRIAGKEPELYSFPMREWRMRFSLPESVAIELARLGTSPESLQSILVRADDTIAELAEAEGRPRRVETIKDPGFEAGERAADFFAGWGTYLSANGGMLAFSGDEGLKREGERSLRIEVTRESEIQWPFVIRQEVSVPQCHEPVKRVSFALSARGKGVDSITLSAEPAYYVTNRKPLAEQTVSLKPDRWSEAKVEFDLPAGRKFAFFIKFTGKKGARLWLDAGSPLPVTYTTVDAELPRWMKARAFLAWVLDGSPLPGGAGATVGLSDAGFEAGSLASSPMAGWFSGDEGARLVRVSADTKRKKQGRQALRFEVLKAKAGAPIIVSQTGDLPEGESFELSIQLCAEKLGWARIQVGYWKDNTHFVELSSHMEPKGTGKWSKATLKFRPPKDKRRFGIFILFPGAPGGRLWLDDARLEAVP